MNTKSFELVFMCLGFRANNRTAYLFRDSSGATYSISGQNFAKVLESLAKQDGRYWYREGILHGDFSVWRDNHLQPV